MTCYLQLHNTTGPPPLFFPHLVPPAIMVWIFVWKYIFEPFIHILQHFVLQLSFYYLLFLGPAAVLLIYTQSQRYETIVKIQRGNPRFDSIFYNNAPVFKKGPSLVLVSKMISLHSYLVYTYEQQIFIDEIQVYSRRHIQLSSTRAHSGGQPNIFCFALFHWSERFSELFLAYSSLCTANPFRIKI
jgi:hypothetical protein